MLDAAPGARHGVAPAVGEMEGGQTQGWRRCRGWSEGGDLKCGGALGLCSEAAREGGSSLGIIGDLVVTIRRVR